MYIRRPAQRRGLKKPLCIKKAPSPAHRRRSAPSPARRRLAPSPARRCQAPCPARHRPRLPPQRATAKLPPSASPPYSFPSVPPSGFLPSALPPVFLPRGPLPPGSLPRSHRGLFLPSPPGHRQAQAVPRHLHECVRCPDSMAFGLHHRRSPNCCLLHEQHSGPFDFLPLAVLPAAGHLSPLHHLWRPSPTSLGQSSPFSTSFSSTNCSRWRRGWPQIEFSVYFKKKNQQWRLHWSHRTTITDRSSLTMKDVKLHHHSQLQYGPVRHEDLELQLFQFIFHMLFSTSTSSSWKKEISPTGASKVTCRAPPTCPQAARRVMPACHQPQLWLNPHGASPLLLPSPCSPAYWRPR
ncbi:uncharacterized protein [Triticum aestivum]|uniref:uncharacterized protein isoform X2 n=1 Tax=Triticum aestivum TaxID=4565 RepID=UPI001D034F12|nr:uncharacterized protein LOC123123492 isoform X2 [Triticum aestivum]